MKGFLFIAFFTCILSGCVMVKYHDYALLDHEIALTTIQQLKEDTLIVVVPTFRKKENLLQNISPKVNDPKSEHKDRLLNLYAEREFMQRAMINAFNEFYTFSDVLYIPDSLITDFENGMNKVFFLNESMQLDPDLSYSNRKPIKLIQQFEQEWQIKTGNKIIPNPFPNYYIYRNGLYGFLGNETYDKMYERVASVFQKRFDQFFLNPEKRIFL